MLVYHPEDSYRAKRLFYPFIEFLIRLIREARVRVSKSEFSTRGKSYFEIWLIEDGDLKKKLKINFAYEPWKGRFVGAVKPINRFRFELGWGVSSLLLIESDDPESYDKMLELFKSILDYFEKYDPDFYNQVLGEINMPSLERGNWRISQDEICKEAAESTEFKEAIDNLTGIKKEKEAQLIAYYLRMGYQITEGEKK